MEHYIFEVEVDPRILFQVQLDGTVLISKVIQLVEHDDDSHSQDEVDEANEHVQDPLSIQITSQMISL
jgi:hypothetical protein